MRADLLARGVLRGIRPRPAPRPRRCSSTGSTIRGFGACGPSCDPFADNDPLATGAHAGSACAATDGCYVAQLGAPGFACGPAGSASLVHGSAAAELANACASGYVPLVTFELGSSSVTCAALCVPGNAYAGNPNPQQSLGQAPHRCDAINAQGTFTGTESCVYAWRLGLVAPLGDAVGLCIDHATHRYDSNGDGVIDGSDATWPACTSMPAGSAAAFGCVDTATASTPTSPLDSELPTYPFE